jgi:hypothetical protein
MIHRWFSQGSAGLAPARLTVGMIPADHEAGTSVRVVSSHPVLLPQVASATALARLAVPGTDRRAVPGGREL